MSLITIYHEKIHKVRVGKISFVSKNLIAPPLNVIITVIRAFQWSPEFLPDVDIHLTFESVRTNNETTIIIIQPSQMWRNRIS